MCAPAVALIGASAAWCGGCLGAVIIHVSCRFLGCFYMLFCGEYGEAGSVFVVFVRRGYIIITGRRVVYVVCFFLCWGCRRLSEPTVVGRVF